MNKTFLIFTALLSSQIAVAADKSAELQAAGAYVNFQPSARSHWHTHPKGQKLIVTSGVGYVQEWGKPVQIVRAGDVIDCPPDVKHWHGAAADSAMTHLAITPYDEQGRNVVWLEAVTDEQYHAHHHDHNHDHKH